MVTLLYSLLLLLYSSDFAAFHFGHKNVQKRLRRSSTNTINARGLANNCMSKFTWCGGPAIITILWVSSWTSYEHKHAARKNMHRKYFLQSTSLRVQLHASHSTFDDYSSEKSLIGNSVFFEEKKTPDINQQSHSPQTIIESLCARDFKASSVENASQQWHCEIAKAELLLKRVRTHENKRTRL